MTDYLTLTEFIPGTKASAQEVNANFSALKDAVNLRAMMGGDSTLTFSVANAALSQHAINKSLLDSSIAACNTKMDGLTNRFCLKSGNINTSGDADLLSYSGTTLSFKIGGAYYSLQWTSANGTQETITTLADITGLSANGIYYVIKELNTANAIATSSKVTQGKAFPASPSNGDYHCLTSAGLSTYKRVSGAWVETQYIQIGTVTVANNVISSVATTPYIQNGFNINTNSFLQSFAANGWQKFPNGLILQWGDAGSINPLTSTIITLPITFPNVFFRVLGSIYAPDTAGTYACQVRPVSNSQIYVRNTDGGSRSICWLAVGY